MEALPRVRLPDRLLGERGRKLFIEVQAHTAVVLNAVLYSCRTWAPSDVLSNVTNDVLTPDLQHQNGKTGGRAVLGGCQTSSIENISIEGAAQLG